MFDCFVQNDIYDDINRALRSIYIYIGSAEPARPVRDKFMPAISEFTA